MTGASFLTSVTSFGDAVCFSATLGGESVEGILACTSGEPSPDIGLGDVPVAPPFVEAVETEQYIT